jgi:Leucine-rich repeat (LRR) protein
MKDHNFLDFLSSFNLGLSVLCLGLSQLSRLDLSQSGLGSIPGGDLCGLTALTHLNLSANRLQDIGDLGLQLPASGCSLPLGSLDLSGSLLMPRPCYYTIRKLLNTVKKVSDFPVPSRQNC